MSKLRADEFVNSNDNGAPSFPHSATIPAPTADNHFATKLYADTSASTKSSSITNTISNTAPSNPSAGDFWTNTTSNIISLNIWNGSSWVNVKNSVEISAGQIVTPPSISDPNGGYIPTMLTATSAVVSGATLSSSKWYKDDVEIPGATGLQYYATDTGTYKYEEVWVDTFGTQLFPSLSAVIDARAGVIDAQPTITSSNGVYSPTTLTATAAVVSNATLVGSRWYKDGVEIPDSSGLSINILAHEGGIYKYEETWTDHFGTQLLPTLSASVQVFATIADPTVLTPAYGTGTNPDFDYTAESSAIANVVDIPGGGITAATYRFTWYDLVYGAGKYVAVANQGTGGEQTGNNQVMYSTDAINWTAASTPAGGRKSIIYGAPSTGTYAGTDIFVAVGGPSSIYSIDGINWSASNEVSGAWNSVAYGNGTFVAVAWSGGPWGTPDKRIMYSTDGMNWTSIYSPDNIQYKGVTYANGKFVACASSGTYPIIYSSDGINWTRANQPPIQYDWEDIVYGGDKFVCIGFNVNKVIYSSDGISWTAATVPEANYWRAITYGDGKFVAVSSNGTNRVMYSTDGINWNATNGLEDNGWYGVGYGDGKFVAVAEAGDNRVMYSVDGANWTQNYVGLTLTDTTVSRASDGSLIEGTSIDQVLTVGEVVRPLGSKSSWVVETDIDEEAKGIGYDSNGNVYVSYKRSGGSGVSKFDADGVLQWKKTFSNGASDNLYNLKVDSSDNIVVSSTTYYGSKARYGIFKINPSGEIQWSKHIDNVNGRTANEVPESGLYIDASDNIYVCGYSNLDVGGGATYQLYMVKLNSSGDLQLNRHLRTSGHDLYGRDVVADNSGNIYISGYGGSYGAGGDVIVAKYNSSGNHQWSRTISSSVMDAPGWLVTDGTHIYVNINNGNPPSTSLVKVNSSGDIVWQRKITTTGASGHSVSVQAMDIDSAGNIYVSGYRTPRYGQVDGVDGFYAKWNSSGTLQWQRYITSDANQYPAFKMSVDDSSGSIYICGRNYHTGYMTLMAAKIPEDGSLTGTHGSYTFGDTNYTESAASFSSNTVYLTSENESLSSYNVPRTVSDSSDTLTTTSFGTSGTITASSGNTITLSDVSGTWSNGMKVQGTTTDFYDSPDPISPSQLLLTSSEPAVTQGSVTTWGNAQWQVAEDSGFTTNVQSLTSALTSSGTQTGPTGFTLDYNKNYYVRTKYGSSNPAGVLSNWSVPSLFKTGEPPLYADDLFSTSFYTGNGGTNNIVNGIDLAGEGGLVWNKDRTYGSHHSLWDTERGATKFISTNQYNRELEYSNSLTSFNSDGFSLGSYHIPNRTADYVSWAFRKAPGFFDIQTWTGNGVPGRAISHNLGSEPGMIMIKRLDASSDWVVWHRSLDNSGPFYEELSLNTTAEASSSGGRFPTTEPTDTEFYVNQYNPVNTTGGTYVAYIFAHDDQSFGTSGNESIIKCGSWTTDSSTGDIPDVDLGWEPQFMIWKSATTTSDWYISDSARGWLGGSPQGGGSFNSLKANKDSIESHASGGSLNNGSGPLLTSTGFVGDGANWGANQTYIYMAIRRPHKPATSATEVFNPVTYTGTGSSFTYNNGFPLDFVWHTHRGGSNTSTWIYDRLRGTHKRLITSTANDEENANFIDFDKQNSVGVNGNASGFNSTNENYIQHVFRRSPGFFDVVTYEGTGSVTTVNHNLAAVPELIILKGRDDSYNWSVYTQTLGRNKVLYLNEDEAASTFNAPAFWGSTDFTSTQFSLGTYWNTNRSGYGYVAYLFASQPGVSKVGSYTGTGGNFDVDCGFAAGARFVLIKRTDGSNGASVGDWYIWDSARAIVSANEPYLLLNDTAAEVTNTDYIDPLNAGFTVTSNAPAALNASGGTYLFLAIA